MGKRGFMFTVDALAAVTVIIALALVWATMPRAKTSEKSYYESLEKIARDETIVALYVNDKSQDNYDSALANYICSKYFKLEPNSDTTPTAVSVYKKCFSSTVVG